MQQIDYFGAALADDKKNFIAMDILLYLRNSVYGTAPDQVISRDGKDYLHRWHVVRKYGKHNVYIHRFLGDDNDEALHDHPWDSVSVVLTGSYREYTPDKVVVRKAGDVIFRDSLTPHRIELVDGEAWTIFITGPKVKEWGFYCPEGLKHWEDFERDGGCND